MESITDQIESAYDDPDGDPAALRDELDRMDNQGVPVDNSDSVARETDGVLPISQQQCRCEGSTHLSEAISLMQEARSYSDRFGDEAEDLVCGLMGQVASRLGQATRLFQAAIEARRDEMAIGSEA